jgi:tetratricopeptide (TPR) repeat protein
MRRRLFGNGHPAVAQSLNNLAMLYRRKGDLTQAEAMMREALGINRNRFGDVHPEVANQLFNLGNLATSRKDFKAAEDWFRQSLEVRRKVWPAEHPDVASAMYQLGSSLMRQGRFTEAEPLVLASFHYNQRTLGTGHTYTQATIKRMVEIYESIGQREKAAEFRALVKAPATAPMK